MTQIYSIEEFEALRRRQSGIVAVAPEPDEIEMSHLGVVMRINGHTSQDLFVAFASKALGLDEFSCGSMPIIKLLASLSLTDPKSYGRCHSLIPLLNGITNGSTSAAHDFFVSSESLKRAYKRTKSLPANFCLECALAEQRNRGRSYWHRELQIPGAIRCTKHQASLYKCSLDDPWLRSPTEQLSNDCARSQENFGLFAETPTYRTYIGVSHAFLETKKPYNARLVSGVLAARCRVSGVSRSTRTARRKTSEITISTLARDKLPAAWLNHLLPIAALTTPIAQLENTVWSGSCQSTANYALACALLFPTTDAAIEAIEYGVECVGRFKWNNYPVTRHILLRQAMQAKNAESSRVLD